MGKLSAPKVNIQLEAADDIFVLRKMRVSVIQGREIPPYIPSLERKSVISLRNLEYASYWDPRQNISEGLSTDSEALRVHYDSLPLVRCSFG